jgi:PAS domain S-box-containing protein
MKTNSRTNSQWNLKVHRAFGAAVLEAAPDAMVVVNQGGEIVLLNALAEKQFGYGRDELIGQKVTTIIPEGFAERLLSDGLRSAADALAQQIGTGIELNGRRRDGGEFPIEIMLRPLESAEGTLVTAAIRDITMRKGVEKHLAQMESRYRGLLEAAPDAMVVVNQSGEIVLLNAQAEKQFGYGRDELIGQKVTTIIPEGFAERLLSDGLRSAADALDQKIGTGIELNGRRRDGGEFPIEIMLSPLESAEGTLVTAAIRDITTRKILEEALAAEAKQLRVSEARLRENRRHLTQAQELSESGSFEHDLRTGQVTWSDNLYTIFGVDNESFAASGIGEFIHPADAARFAASYRRQAAGIATTATEFRIVRPDEGCRTIIVEYAFRPGDYGAAGIVLGTVRDVTNAKAAEQRVRGLETQLHHSQKLEALGTLAGGIAHDLNNALVPTIVMTDIVMDSQAADSPERARLALAIAGARRAKELVRRILTFARKETTEKNWFDLASLVTEAMTMLRASLPATIEQVVLLEPIPAVFGDSGQLYQVIVNLVTNAAQAIDDESGKIAVRLRSVSDGSQIELTVADTGSGMDETTLERVFDPFFTTRPVNEGTGLGLSIVHGIVVAHGGTIAVTSQLGRGSKFNITLPVAGGCQERDAAGVPAAA